MTQWTVDTLHEHMTQRVADILDLLNERHASQARSLEKAETALEKRFESVNEFRKALSDQTGTFLPRAEYDTAHTALETQVKVNADAMAALELRLTSRLDQNQGRDTGVGEFRSERRLDVGQVMQFALLVLVAAGTFFTIIHG